MKKIYEHDAANMISLTRFKRRADALVYNRAQDTALVALCTQFIEGYAANPRDYSKLNKLMTDIKKGLK